jgi:Leucine-rich repeat (LRR) protein
MEDISLVIRRCKRSNEVKLSLAGKGLFQIPSSLFELNALQHLNLSGNKITSLDPKLV